MSDSNPVKFPLATGAEDAPAARCYWVLKEGFLAGAYPGSAHAEEHRRRVAAIWQAGIRTFINLVEEHEKGSGGKAFSPYAEIVRELAEGDGAPVACIRLPVRDVSIPSIDGMRSILDVVDLSLAADRPVYVHCWGGVGRTGTVVGCWLLRHGHADRDTVLQALQRLRRADKETSHRPAPESREQIEFLKAWTR